jgi:hypothetical protein
MSFLCIVALWAFLGGSLYRSHRRGRQIPDDRTTGDSGVELGHRHVRADIPDTVPSDWVESYRTENGG